MACIINVFVSMAFYYCYIYWRLGIFFSQKATVQLRTKLIPEEHVDDLANTYGNDLLSRSLKLYEIFQDFDHRQSVKTEFGHIDCISWWLYKRSSIIYC